jgi:hypothetical protein
LRRPPTQHQAELLSTQWALTLPDPGHPQVTLAPPPPPPPPPPSPPVASQTQTTRTMVYQPSSTEKSRIPQQRNRKKYYGESFRLEIQQLDDIGQRAVTDYGGTTDQGRAWLLHSWKTYTDEHPQFLPPIIRKGRLGSRGGGGEMECTLCKQGQKPGKTNKTLQKAMAHLFDHWKMSLFYCGLHEW